MDTTQDELDLIEQTGRAIGARERRLVGAIIGPDVAAWAEILAGQYTDPVEYRTFLGAYYVGWYNGLSA
jgi:hypothetical protein